MAREVLGFRNVELVVGGQALLEDASFSFSEESRVALVGPNGSGKSTLLSYLASILEPSKGTLAKRRDVLVEYVPQFVPPELARTSVVGALIDNIDKRRPTIDQWKAYELLSRFGFDPEVFERPLGSLSGGEANRALLARALVVEPDFLLLDEPTNHMDSESIVKFERLMKEELRIPFCVVSHDRTLLDSCTNQTLFLRDKRLYNFGLPYTEAKLALRTEDQARVDSFRAEEREIARLKVSAERLKGWVKTNSDLAARYRGMKKRIANLEGDRTFVSREKAKNLSLGEAELRARAAIRIEDLKVETPDRRLLYQIESLVISPGDRIAILGRNGSGKTTLLRTIVEAFTTKDDGEQRKIRFNPQVVIGYYDQELHELNPEDTIFNHVLNSCNKNTDPIRKELIAAGFPYKRHGDKVGELSGGQKARLQFVALKLREPNVYILDEPTNHIDVEGIERLEDQVNDSNATFVMVSHDRRFIDNVANRFFLINDGRLVELSSPDDYYQMILDGTLGQGQKEQAPRPKQKKSKAATNGAASSSTPLEDSIEGTMDRIEQLEAALAAEANKARQDRILGQIETLYKKLEDMGM